MRLPAAIVLLLLYTASGVVGQPRIVNPGEPDPDAPPTTTSLETTTTTTTTTSSETTTSSTSTEITSTSTSDSTSSSISTTSKTSTSTSISIYTITEETTTTTESSSSTSDSSSSSSSISTTTTTEEPSTTSETTTSEGTTSTSESSTSTSEGVTSTTESTSTTTTETETSESETSTTTEDTSTTESETSTTESSTSTTDPATTTSSPSEESTTTSGESTTTAPYSSTTETTTSETTAPESTTTESTTSESTTSESTTADSTTTENSTTETTTVTAESTTDSTTTDSTTTDSTTTDSTTTEPTTSDSTTIEPTTTDSTTESTGTTDSSTSETSTDTSSITIDTTTETTTEETTTVGTTDSTTSEITTESDTATTTSDSTTTDSTTSETTSETTSITQGTVTEYVYPTNGCEVPGARCHFYSMELNPTLYFVTTLTVDDSTSTSTSNVTIATVAGFSSENPDITTIQPNNTILSNTGNIIPSSLATLSNPDDITFVYPTTYQFIIEYDLPVEPTPTDFVASTSDGVDFPTTTSNICPDNTILVTIPAYSDFTVSVLKGCTQYQAFLNFTRTLAITTKTAVVIETKGKDSMDGFKAPIAKSSDSEMDINANSRPTKIPSPIPNSGDPQRSPVDPQKTPVDPQRTPVDPQRSPGPLPDKTTSENNRPNFGPMVPQTSKQPNKGPNQDPNQNPNESPTGRPNQENTRAPDPDPIRGPSRGPNRGGSDLPDQTLSGGQNEQPNRGPRPTSLPNPNPDPNTTGSNRPGTRTFNPNDFTLLMMPTSSRPAPGQSVTPGPNPTRRRAPEPSIEPIPVVRTISGTVTTSTTFVGITNVPKTTVIRMPGGGSSTLVLLTESMIPITSFQPRVSAEPVVTTINGRPTTFLNVVSISAKPTVVLVTTSINGRRTVLSETFFLPTTVPVPQFTPFLTTTIGPTIINGLPTFGPTVVTLAPITRTTFLTDIVSGTTILRRTTYIMPAISTLPNPLIQTLRISTTIDGRPTIVSFPISLSASSTTRVVTTSIDGTRRIFTTTFFVPQGFPILNLPSVILKTTTIDNEETTFSEFYTIQPITITTTIGGRETVVLVPSVIPITTPRTFFSTSFLRTTVNGRPTSIPEVYFLKPTTITTVIEGRTSLIQTTTAILVTTARIPEITSTRGPSPPGNNSTSSSNYTVPAISKVVPTTGIPLPPIPSQTGTASSIGLGSLLVCFGALLSSMVMILV